jgi:hypothetical protein
MTYKAWRKIFDKICVSKDKSFEGRDTQIEELYAMEKTPKDAVVREMNRARKRKFRSFKKNKLKGNIYKLGWSKRNKAKKALSDLLYREKNRVKIAERERKRLSRVRMERIQEEIASLKNDNWFMEAHNKRIHLTK